MSTLDLDPDERDLHLLLAAVPPTALPFGFRDRLMSRLRAMAPEATTHWCSSRLPVKARCTRT